MLNRNALTIHIIVIPIIVIYHNNDIFSPVGYSRFSVNLRIELGLSNYATKTGLKGATGVDASNLVAKAGLVSLKV